MVDRVSSRHPKLLVRSINVDKDAEAQAYALLGFQGVPATVLVDHEGGYLTSFSGAMPEEELERTLTDLGY